MPPDETMVDYKMDDPKDHDKMDDLTKVVDAEVQDHSIELDPISKMFGFKTPLIWSNIFYIFAYHFIAVYGFLTFPYLDHKLTTAWIFVINSISGFGITGGVHRYFTHRSYKAKLPLRIILLMSFISSGQNSVFEWVRDHRIHHKYTETDADPHNSNRGFFFAHVGWLMMKKHPEVLRRGRQVDMSDVTADPVVQFGEKYFSYLRFLLVFFIPTIIPIYFWNEDWYHAIISQCFMRYVMVLNMSWSVNSFAHLWGYRSYDKSISPAENRFVAFIAMGEGWHNYHHVFPWDYKTGELGIWRLNVTAMWIDIFASIGWAYDRKVVPKDLIAKVVAKKGDGTHYQLHGWREVEPTGNAIVK